VPRLSMLETVREYGWERLIERQEAEESQRMHALYYLALAEEAALHLREGGSKSSGWDVWRQSRRTCGPFSPFSSSTRKLTWPSA
jgi:predicted ATPase